MKLTFSSPSKPSQAEGKWPAATRAPGQISRRDAIKRGVAALLFGALCSTRLLASDTAIVAVGASPADLSAALQRLTKWWFESAEVKHGYFDGEFDGVNPPKLLTSLCVNLPRAAEHL